MLELVFLDASRPFSVDETNATSFEETYSTSLSKPRMGFCAIVQYSERTPEKPTRNRVLLLSSLSSSESAQRQPAGARAKGEVPQHPACRQNVQVRRVFALYGRALLSSPLLARTSITSRGILLPMQMNRVAYPSTPSLLVFGSDP